MPVFQHKWFYEEILQKEEGSGQLGGWWIVLEFVKGLELSAWLKPWVAWQLLQAVSHSVLSCWQSFFLFSIIQSFGL